MALLVQEWRIEDVSASDGTLVQTWTANVGIRNFTSPAGYIPAYKTNITPSGMSVMRHDGHSYHPINAAPVTPFNHIFIVAAVRGAPTTKYNTLVNFGGTSTAINTALASEFDLCPNLTVKRDGVTTRTINFGGFSIYEFIIPQGSGLLPSLVCCSLNNVYFGTWDYCYVAAYDAELTGPALTALRFNLTAKYITPRPIVTTTTLPNSELLTYDPYNQTLALTGGTPPFAWSIVGGALPDGLTLDPATGIIAGRATKLGTFNFTVRVTDLAGYFDDQALQIIVGVYTGPPRFPDPTTNGGILWEHFAQLPIDYSKSTVTHVYEDEGRSFNETTTVPAIRWDVTFTGLSFDESAIFENFARSVRLTVPFTFRDKWGTIWTNVRVDSYERSHSRNISWSHSVHFVLVKYP